ncbi:MAG TPA: hypothetical protein PLK94_10495, partial [Alphaproteobacteria bacterium]|nr:hypothetical protein [Alphaproteobacteria bacterium]
IDFYHMQTAYKCIDDWFNKHGHRRQHAADEFYGYLFKTVKVIWYEAPSKLDSATLFTRLNVGRIPLTNAELVKALLLSSERDRAEEIATFWDVIERDLQVPGIWSFVTDANAEDYPTRINLILDTIAGGPTGPRRPLFHTFDTLRDEMESSSPYQVWRKIVNLHGLILGWHANRDFYHKIGYLVASGSSFADLVSLAQGCTKTDFMSLLDQEIRERLKLTKDEVADLGYENQPQKCEQLLLLMNVETVRRLENSSERYPFYVHASKGWSLEHIHAQNAESLTKEEQWKEWLRLHRNALDSLPTAMKNKGRYAILVQEIDAIKEPIGRAAFQKIAKDVTEIFTNEQGLGTLHSMHAVSNLALLSKDDNSALGNSVFEVKRQHILDMDRKGSFIPICTRQVFLKYYTDADAQQIHFWGAQDRESYLEAIKEVLKDYFRPEEKQP